MRHKAQTDFECPLLAQSGPAARDTECPLLGVKRTSPSALHMSAYDPKRTFASVTFVTAIGAALLKGEDALPVVLHVGYDPFIQRCGVQGFIEATEGCVPIIGVFAYCVSVMDD